MNARMARMGSTLVLLSLPVFVTGCDAVSRGDELKAQTELCEKFLKEVKGAKDPGEAKKVFDDYESKLEKAHKATQNATGWLSVPPESSKAYKECYDSARSGLEKHDGKLAIKFGEIHGGS